MIKLDPAIMTSETEKSLGGELISMEIQSIKDENWRLKAKLREAEQCNHHHWVLAVARLQEIDAIRASMSWKLTYPLRLISKVCRYALALVLKMLQKTLQHAVIIVFNKPALKQRLKHLIKAQPWLQRMVHSWLERLGPFAVVTASSRPVSFDELESVKLFVGANQVDFDVSLKYLD